MSGIVFLISVVLIQGVSSQFDPLVNVESCTKEKLLVSTYGAEDGGLIYIQGQGENCKQVTASGTTLHEFDFAECGIQWEQLFKIVVQKNQLYQTGADKQLPIFCIADRSDLLVDNLNFAGNKDDDFGLNMTVRPSATMSFFKVISEVEVSGQEVKLTDQLIMALRLGDEWIDDFDIKARYCVASNILIIDKLRGYLVSEFGAFRTTDTELAGGATLMNFSCILQVCKGDCEQTTCSGGDSGWGRKRRNMGDEIIYGEITVDSLQVKGDNSGDVQHVHKRQAQDNGLSIDVGGKVKIVERYSEIQFVQRETLCMPTAKFIVIIIFLSMGVLIFGTATAVIYRKWTRARSEEATSRDSQEPANISKYKQGFKNNIGNPSSGGAPVFYR